MARYLNHRYRLTLEVPANLPDTPVPLRTLSGVDRKVVITELQIKGTIKLDKSSKSNMLRLDIYNLTDASVDIASQEDLLVKLEVSYPGEPFKELFNGGMITVTTRPSGATGVNKVTSIVASDGYSSVRESQTSRTWTSRSITVEDILRELILEDLGLAIGNIHNGDNAPGTGLNYSFPVYSATGPTYTIIDDITDGFDLEWNIHNGKVDIYPRGSSRSFADEIPVYSPFTGLLRSPNKVIIHPDRAKSSNDKKTGKRLEVILNPVLIPGGKVRIESQDIKEEVTIKEIIHDFNWWRGKWVSIITTEDT